MGAPLSVCCDEEGRTVGTSHHKIEVNCVIADMDILCRQPVCLLLLKKIQKNFKKGLAF